MHRLYKASGEAWDAALLKLESPSRFRPVALAPADARYLTSPVRDRFLTAGFGTTQAQDFPDDLRATWVPFQDRGECIALAEANDVGTPPYSHICAGERAAAAAAEVLARAPRLCGERGWRGCALHTASARCSPSIARLLACRLSAAKQPRLVPGRLRGASN